MNQLVKCNVCLQTSNNNILKLYRGTAYRTLTKMTLEQLKAKRQELVNNLRDSRDLNPIRKIDSEIKALEREQLLKGVNSKQQRLREIARQVYECEQPDTDITTNDGSFHAVKVKQYPKLAALQYARATFRDGHMTEIKIGRDSFNIFNVKYEYSKPNVYTRPETFKEFLELNSIMVEDMTLQAFNDVIAKNEEANKQFYEAVKVLSAKQDELKLHALAYWDLFRQENARHIYKYSAK